MAKDYSKYLLNVKPSPKDRRDWQYKTVMGVKEYTYPQTLDMRNGLLPIRDQGNQGSCVAMAGAAMKEWQERIDVHLHEYLSPQFIYNLRPNAPDEGMYPRDLMKILTNYGVCLEHDYPYMKSFRYPNDLALEKALNYKIKGYAQVLTPCELKQALNDMGPCTVAVPVYDTGERMWYKKYDAQKIMGGHQMLVVGYTENEFIIRNSWGDEWGKGGYCFMPIRDFDLAWEYWSSVDAESNPDVVPPRFNWKKIIIYGGIGLAIALLWYFYGN